MSLSILKIDDWQALQYPKFKLNNTEISKRYYSKGLYRMEGVLGYEFFEVKHRISITTLKINNKTVMVDDPLHWYGMKALAEASVGKVCIAGLGLGLLLHHLKKNKLVNDIDVYEISENVIDLISPYLPKDYRVTIIHDDFFRENWRRKKYDTIILDLWVGQNGNFKICGTNKNISMFIYYHRVLINNPHSKVFLWGVKDHSMNPSLNSIKLVPPL